MTSLKDPRRKDADAGKDADARTGVHPPVESPEPPEPTRRGRPDEVAERLQTEILRGTFRPGDRLPTERELALQLHVNRSSVREGLKKLQQLRLIEIQQGSGIRVLEPEQASFDLVMQLLFPGGRPDRTVVEDLLELRDAIVRWTLELVMDRSSHRDLAQAAQLAADAAALQGPDQGEAFLFAMREFQAELTRLSRNRVLILLANALQRSTEEPEQRPFVESILQERSALAPTLAALAVALRSKDRADARSALNQILERLGSAVMRGVDQILRSSPK